MSVLCLNFYNRCHANAFKGFSTLWDNVYEYGIRYMNMSVTLCMTVAMLRDSRSYVSHG
jgi:hypothetical protein